MNYDSLWSNSKDLMNTLMYILVSLAEFILLIFCKSSEAVVSSIIFPNGNNTCSCDKSPLSLTMTFILVVQSVCAQQPSSVRKVVKTITSGVCSENNISKK